MILSLDTPFRLIDDYGDWRVNFSEVTNSIIHLNKGRFRPTFEIGNIFYWSLFGTNSTSHHAFRFLVKILSYILFYKIIFYAHYKQNIGALRNLKEYPLVSIISFGLFFIFPNNPEARLAPQELSTVFFLLSTSYFFICVKKTTFNYMLSLVSFILLLWSKETNIFPGFVLLCVVFYDFRKIKIKSRILYILPFLLFYVFTFIKVYYAAQSGYGTETRDIYGVLKNIRYVFINLFMPGNRPDIVMSGFLLFPFIYSVKEKIFSKVILEKEFLIIFFLFLSLAFTFVIGWAPILRYMYPAVVLYLMCFLLLLIKVTPVLDQKTISVWFLLFVLTISQNYIFQFETQRSAGIFEEAVLLELENTCENSSIGLIDKNEFFDKVNIYFLHFSSGCTKINFSNTNKDFLLTMNKKNIPDGWKISKVLKTKLNETPISDKISLYTKVLRPISFIKEKYNYRWIDAGVGRPIPWYLLEKVSSHP